MIITDTDKIKVIQKILGIEPQTGLYDEHTKAAVKNFNLRVGNGSIDVLDSKTYTSIVEKLGTGTDLNFYNESVRTDNDSDCTTDLSETDASFEIYSLDPDEYVTSNGKILKKEYIFLHHTSGWSNPYATIDDWNRDSRGRIGTHFVIGGIDIKTGDAKHDGRILKCIPDEYFAWHLGSTSKDKISMHMHVHSVGIEICNMGYLTQKGNAYYTYTGARVHEKYVEDLGFNFRGFRYWHKYTDEQIDSTYALINTLQRKYNIDIAKGLKGMIEKIGVQKAFDFDQSARDGKIKGLLSHTNVRKDKTDVSPQKNLVEMIKSL
jgi:N-acetyl-anhydromuramyl-L-alanine amidase AmpD